LEYREGHVEVVHLKPRKRKFMSIIRVGTDLAKDIFAAHGVGQNG